jgi:hypothetical protein
MSQWLIGNVIFQGVQRHKRTITLKIIAKTKLANIKGKIGESKFIIQNLDQHIIKIKVKFDNNFKNCIIDLNKLMF